MPASYPDTIFVQTDPSFVVVFQSLIELKKQGRLRETYRQYALINPIASANPEDPTLFGESHPQFFARTASSAIRMCMLKATGIEDDLWPSISDDSQKGNETNCLFECEVHPNGEDQFCLCGSDSKDKARRYWSKYDQLYPHFLIQDKLGENYGEQAELNSMMVIIRNNFTQVIEILTNFSVTCTEEVEPTKGNKTKVTYKFDRPRVHVRCIVLEFDPKNNGKKDGEYTRFLKELIKMCQKFEVKNFESELNDYVKQEQEQEDDDEDESGEKDDDDKKEEEGARGGEEGSKGQKKKEKKKE